MAPNFLAVLTAIATFSGQAWGLFSVVEPGTVANSSTSTLAPSCVSAIESEVKCDAYLRLQANTDLYGADTVSQATVCTAACSSSLSSYISSVESNCAGQPLPWDDMPHAYFGKVLQATYNMSCLQDPATGQYCTRKLKRQTRAKPLATLELTKCNRGLVGLRSRYGRRPYT